MIDSGRNQRWDHWRDVGINIVRFPIRSGLLQEIGGRLRELRVVAAQHGQRALTPLLVLGTFERVGSNWFSDTLRPSVTLHNEPFRQQLHPTHPFSALNPDLVRIENLRTADLHPYERHWLVTFVLSKYGRERHVVKETNLFFAVHNVLGLFPDAPVVVLSRSPVGIASSFARAGLFERWGYVGRYAQVYEMAQRPKYAGYRFAVQADSPSKLRMLARLITLNALLVAGAVKGRPMLHVAYEEAVRDQRAALEPVATLLFGDAAAVEAVATSPDEGPAPLRDDTFDTRLGKRELVARLNPADVVELRTEIGRVLADAEDALPNGTVVRARRWLTEHLDAYTVAEPSPLRILPRPDSPVPEPVRGVKGRFVVDSHRALWWRNTLVTNTEFCRFLNEMRGVRLPNVIGGTHLFVNEAMPHSRGGRIVFSHSAGQYQVCPGYENHPVYWVTWIGAAAYARYTGCRLPSRVEIDAVTTGGNANLNAINAEYRIGDVLPVTEPGLADDRIHHLVGNVQVWCADGPAPPDVGDTPACRFIYGAAWNTPATIAEIRRTRSRHITGCSRGVGIRLIRDGRTAMAEPAAMIAERLRTAFTMLANRDQRLSKIDADFIAALTGPAH